MLIANQKFTRMFAVVAFFLAVFANAGMARASEITSKRMVELTNNSRLKEGLNALIVNDKLALAAQEKAEDMFAKEYFEHVSPDGTVPWHWFDVAGYDYAYAAENLAIDFITAEGAHSAFMKSTGHRENILGANYKEIGIAVVSGKFDGRDSIIIVEEFGTSREYSGSMDTFFEKPESAEIRVAQVPTANLAESKPQQATVADNPEEQGRHGKIVTQAYSVSELRRLKRAYSEDIYWRKAEKGRVCYQYLAYGKAKLKYLLNNLTHGQCCVSAGE